MQSRQGESLSIKLREASFLDIPRMVKIEKRVFKKPWGFDAFFGEFFKSFSKILVAEVDGKLAGFAVLWILPPEAYLANIAVDPEFQGLGIGTRLLEAVEEMAKDSGANYIILEVRVSNKAAIRLYEKFGFEPVGLRKGMYFDGEDGLVMEKLL